MGVQLEVVTIEDDSINYIPICKRWESVKWYIKL